MGGEPLTCITHVCMRRRRVNRGQEAIGIVLRVWGLSVWGQSKGQGCPRIRTKCGNSKKMKKDQKKGVEELHFAAPKS